MKIRKEIKRKRKYASSYDGSENSYFFEANQAYKVIKQTHTHTHKHKWMKIRKKW